MNDFLWAFYCVIQAPEGTKVAEAERTKSLLMPEADATIALLQFTVKYSMETDA